MQFRLWLRFLLVLTILSLFSLAAGAAQAASGGSGRLVVYRSASFGTTSFLQLWIDGSKAGEIGPGKRYDQPIPPGNHVLAVNYAPRTRHETNSTPLTVHPGQTYVFTATRDYSEGVVLRLSK